jgi:hypothetical protein
MPINRRHGKKESESMPIPFKIIRDRWTLHEVMSDEMDRPGRGAFALVLDDEHFPHFKHPQSKEFALALESAAEGGPGGTVKLGDTTITIEKGLGGVTIHTPAGLDRKFNVDDALGLARDLTSPLAQTLTPAP